MTRENEKKHKHSIEDQLIAYESYVQVIERLQHFNKMQTTYRTYAFTWLLGTFLGIGYSLSSREAHLPFHPLIIVMLICIASSAGVFLIWYMDLMMCERMIATALYEGLECENKFPWIPKINQSSNTFHTLWGYVHLKAIFYFGYFTILYATFGTALAIYLKNSKWIFLGPLSFVLIISLIIFFLVVATKKSDTYKRIEKIIDRVKED